MSIYDNNILTYYSLWFALIECKFVFIIYAEIFGQMSSGGLEVSFSLYYIFKANLLLFSVIFDDDKNTNFLRRDKSFRTFKHTKSHQNQNK